MSKSKSSGSSKGEADKVMTGGKSSGLKISKEMRSDTTKAVSNKNPYPKGMS